MKLKQKDIIYLFLAIAMFAMTGILAVSLLAPKKGSGGPKVATTEVVTPISPEFSSEGQSDLANPAVSRDFTQPIDLTTGLGNPQLFGPY